MEQGTSAQPSMTDLLAGMGVVVTDEGRANARTKLADAQAKVDPVRREALKRRLGLLPRTA